MAEKTEYYTTTTTTTTTTNTNYADQYSADEKFDDKTVVMDDQHVQHVTDTEQGEVEEYDTHGNHINFVMSETEKKLIRKLDFIYVMPYVCILNFLQVRQNNLKCRKE